MTSVSMIEAVAASLGELCERFVFVGGATLELLITDPTVLDFRPTTDVGLLVEADTYGTYASVEQTLTEKGFAHVIGPGVPICRWRIGAVVADVMPTEELILGYGNRWYPDVVRTAESYTLPSGSRIRITAPQYFPATKLEAYHERGNADARISYDMEDIIAVLDGRPGIENEVMDTEPTVRSFLVKEFRLLLSDLDFGDAIQGYLSTTPDSTGRRKAVLQRLKTIARQHP